MKIPPSDYKIQQYYKKYLERCAIKRNNIAIKMSNAQDNIIKAKQDLLPNINLINKLAEVSIEESIEFIEEKLVADSLIEKLIEGAIFKVIKLEDREALNSAIKYFNALREYDFCKNEIKLIDRTLREFKYNSKTFKDILYNYYCCGVVKCLIEGYAYKLNNNIGNIMIKNVKDGSKLRIDYAKTKANKEKLLKLGYKIKDKDNPDGMDYRIYIRTENHKELYFFGGKFKPSDFCIEISEYCGDTLVRAREKYKNVTNIQEIFDIKDKYIIFKSKLSLCTEKDPGLAIRYNRGDSTYYEHSTGNKIIKTKYRNE